MADKEESIENLPVFASPCRIFEMNEDPINQKCKRILGDYEIMQTFISDFLYISSQERPEILHNFPKRRLDVSYRGIGPFTKNMQPDIKVPPMRYQKKAFSLISANRNCNSTITQITHDNEHDVNIHNGGNHNITYNQTLEHQQTPTPSSESTAPTSFNQVEKMLTPVNPVKPIDLCLETPTIEQRPVQLSLLPTSGQTITFQKNGTNKEMYCKPEQHEMRNYQILDANTRTDTLKERNVEEMFRFTIVKSALEPPLSPISSPINEWKNANQLDQSLSNPANNKRTVSLQTILSEIITRLKPLSPIQSPKLKSADNNSLKPDTKNVELNVLWPCVDDLNIRQISENKKEWEERHILEPQYSHSSVVEQSSSEAHISGNNNASIVSVCKSPNAPIYNSHIKYGIEEIDKKSCYPRRDSYSVEIMTKTEKYLPSLDNMANYSSPKERKDLSQGFKMVKCDKSVVNERDNDLNRMKYNFNMSEEQKCSMTVHQLANNGVPLVNTLDENEYLKQTKYSYINEIQDGKKSIKFIAKESPSKELSYLKQTNYSYINEIQDEKKTIKFIAKESPSKELSYNYQYKTEHQSPSPQITFANTSKISPLKIAFSDAKMLKNKFSKDVPLRQIVNTQEYMKPYSTGSHQNSLRPYLNVEKDISAALIFSSPKYKVNPFDILNHRCSVLKLPIYSLTQREKKLVIKIPMKLLDNKLIIKMKSKFDKNYKKRIQHSHFTRKKWSICIMVKIKTVLLNKVPYCHIYKDIKDLRPYPYSTKHNRICSEDLFNKSSRLLGSGLLETHCFNDSNSYNARANYLKDQAKIMKPAAQKFLNLMSAMWYIMCGHIMEEEHISHNSVITFFQRTFEFLERIGHFDDSRMETLKLLLQSIAARKIYLLRNFQMKQLKIDLTEESNSVFGRHFSSQQFNNYIQQNIGISKNEYVHPVTVSRRWLSLNNDYVEIMELLVQSNQFWMESEYLMQENKDFFSLFGNKCQTLSLNGDIPFVVNFVKDCLELLQPNELKIYTEFQKHIKFENSFI